MELVYEKIDELTEEQFKALLDFIGNNIIKTGLIEQASSFPKTSNYYIGPRTTGSFWSGFRKENIPISRVKKFYIDEVYKNKTSLNTSFFKKIIEEKIMTITDFNETYIMSQETNLCSALCKLYSVVVSEETQKYINEINKLKEDNDARIKTLVSEYEEKMKNIKDEFVIQKSEYEKVLKDLKNQLLMVQNQKSNYKTEILNNVIDSSAYYNLATEINLLNLENIDSVKEYLKGAFTANVELLNSNEFDKLAKELTIQFIITKIMEAK